MSWSPSAAELARSARACRTRAFSSIASGLPWTSWAGSWVSPSSVTVDRSGSGISRHRLRGGVVDRAIGPRHPRQRVADLARVLGQRVQAAGPADTKVHQRIVNAGVPVQLRVTAQAAQLEVVLVLHAVVDTVGGFVDLV